MIDINPFKIHLRISTQIFNNIQIILLEISQLQIYSTSYSIAAHAFTKLIEKTQAIVISGESGAGKTENARYCLNLLTSVNSEESELSDKIMGCNPILEAFGNAKTIRNKNSNRFGKYTRLFVNNKQQIIGGDIVNYLLEKSRVVSHSKNRSKTPYIQFIIWQSKILKIIFYQKFYDELIQAEKQVDSINLKITPNQYKKESQKKIKSKLKKNIAQKKNESCSSYPKIIFYVQSNQISPSISLLVFEKRIKIIQRQTRGYIVRLRLGNMHEAVCLIQGYFRMKNLSCIFQRLRQATIKIQRRFRMILPSRRELKQQHNHNFQQKKLKLKNIIDQRVIIQGRDYKLLNKQQQIGYSMEFGLLILPILKAQAITFVRNTKQKVVKLIQTEVKAITKNNAKKQQLQQIQSLPQEKVCKIDLDLYF